MGTRSATATPPEGVYRRHEPEKTILHGIVREHLETFLSRAGGCDGDGYPRFVEREFRRYLDCGILCNGFARLRCGRCGFERLVAFSCKGKLCPSCLARRSADTAAWLVDRILPEAGYRQWVLTFPWTLRFRLAADRALLGELLGVFLRSVFAWQRRRGRERGIVDGQTGAVTFVQRFGGALNLNPHFHSILPDGLWVAGSEGDRAPGGVRGLLRFEPLPPPTTAEVEELTQTIARRLSERVAAAWEGDGGDYLDPELAALCEAFFFSRNPPLSMRASPTLEGMEEAPEGAAVSGKPLCASVAGFSLHAAQAALELHSHKRVEAGAGGEIATPPRCRPRLAWAQLLRRVLHVDALRCPRCSTSAQSAPMVVLAFLTDPEVAGKILRHLGLPSCAPALAPARVASWGLPSGHLPPPVPCADGGAGQGEVGPAWPVSSEESESRGDHGDAPPPIRPPP